MGIRSSYMAFTLPIIYLSTYSLYVKYVNGFIGYFFFLMISAGFISLTSIILVEFLGLDKLTNAFGLIILFRGAATVFGTPLAGTIYDLTKSYTIPFFVCAAGFGIASVISMSAPCFNKKVEEKDGEVLAPMNVTEEKDQNIV